MKTFVFFVSDLACGLSLVFLMLASAVPVIALQAHALFSSPSDVIGLLVISWLLKAIDEAALQLGGKISSAA